MSIFRMLSISIGAVSCLVAVVLAGTVEDSVDSDVSELRELIESEKPLDNEVFHDLSDSELIELLNALPRQQALDIVDNHLGARGMPLPADLLFELGGMPAGVLDTMLAMSLPALGYEASEQGIKGFQADLGENETGELTIGQMVELIKRYTRTKDTKVIAFAGGEIFSEEIEIQKYDSEINVEGTWVSENEELVYPVNTSIIRCFKERGTCLISSSHVVIPSLDSNEDVYSLEVFLEDFKIVSWTQNEITAVKDGLCRASTLTINIPSNEVYEITRNNWGEHCDAFPYLSKLPTPHVKKLMAGYSATAAFWEQRRESMKAYFNSQLKADIEELFISEPSQEYRDEDKEN